MQLVYQTSNLFDAHLVKHALEDAGIPAFVFGESLLGAGGELPLFGLLRVCVPDPAKPEADDIVAALGLDEGEAGPICDDDEAPGLLPA
ncbi:MULTISPECIES: DUF2007 domain-containing protein [Stenotrophomonas]|uniref:DUF2007 domain-containing protein n=1 Tax=Stenotrophomonas nitritireducens TaxID=83617 RepID=A0A9D8L052_9GAMM|nr:MULTISPECIES: DUF2007 domain-containing protein [Stenotrophomonas]KQO00002.1 hypothetical protein ASF01_03265 [Stenotrophomonas sp. Leaf70]KRG54166.1 hypothetical protein ABB22_16640 [Stenotrophomonas nitritireducens]MBN8791271.1 DUF2007 domain-containing protein [Stenotrophomonas nitritireducens]MBN8795215.1 DUF2007 domain-containing protein [Stenotrophomonas nitritireducens]MBN8799117.1 DUF2007 domain-containing protein [Stenotrophomonas nitritireducens]